MNKAIWVVVPLLCLLASPSGASSLQPPFRVGDLEGVQVGARFDEVSATSQGLEMAETVESDTGHGIESLVRFERDDEDSLSFVEVAAADRVVRSIGWTRILPRAVADSAAAVYLGSLVRSLGLPDDLVSEDDAHAVAWVDQPHSLRLELVMQKSEEQRTDWELTVVLRKD
jgi:hypothetical protein